MFWTGVIGGLFLAAVVGVWVYSYRKTHGTKPEIPTGGKGGGRGGGKGGGPDKDIHVE